MIQANNEIRVSCQHAKFELLAWTIRAMHATNRFVGSPFNTDTVPLSYTQKYSPFAHKHKTQTFTFTKHYIRLVTHRMSELQNRIVFVCSCGLRGKNGSDRMCATCFGMWCEPEINVTKNNRKTNVCLWVKCNTIENVFLLRSLERCIGWYSDYNFSMMRLRYDTNRSVWKGEIRRFKCDAVNKKKMII